MHPEADALLDAIFDHPDDDTPRLVYADWLQEHGQEDYAQFIRLSIRIARVSFSPDEQRALRKERYLLGQRLEKANPTAFCVTRARGRNPDGLPKPFQDIDAKAFLDSWPDWWPFVRPRVLRLRRVPGHEEAVARCPYLSRIHSLWCDGIALMGFSQQRDDVEEWKPVSGILLRELDANAELHRLTVLRVEPITPTREELLTFAETALAGRLEELHLWVEFGWNSHEELRASTGFIQHEIHRFLAEHGNRLPGVRA
jgi:uncharacterized protein (TIGR02996 family)